MTKAVIDVRDECDRLERLTLRLLDDAARQLQRNGVVEPGLLNHLASADLQSIVARRATELDEDPDGPACLVCGETIVTTNGQRVKRYCDSRCQNAHRAQCRQREKVLVEGS